MTTATATPNLDDTDTVGVPARDLQPGQFIFDSFYGDWLRVDSIRPVTRQLPGGPAVERLAIRFVHRDFTVRRDVKLDERFAAEAVATEDGQ